MDLALVVLTAALVITTVVYAVYTAKMAAEMRETRELGIRPRLGLLIRPVDPNIGLIEIRSLGPGTALAVSVRLVQEPAAGQAERAWQAAVFWPGEKARLKPLPPSNASPSITIQTLADAQVRLRLDGSMLEIDGKHHAVKETFEVAPWWAAIREHQIYEADPEMVANRERKRTRSAVERIAERLASGE